MLRNRIRIRSDSYFFYPIRGCKILWKRTENQRAKNPRTVFTSRKIARWLEFDSIFCTAADIIAFCRFPACTTHRFALECAQFWGSAISSVSRHIIGRFQTYIFSMPIHTYNSKQKLKIINVSFEESCFYVCISTLYNVHTYIAWRTYIFKT